MTDRDREILHNLPDWDPPVDIAAARESWEQHAARLPAALPTRRLPDRMVAGARLPPPPGNEQERLNSSPD
jgi:hypothetical protein